MSIADQMIALPGADIFVRQSAGRGLPVLMLHGSGASHLAFRRQFESPLADKFRLIAMDLPGHGLSGDAGDPTSTYTAPGLARLTAQLVEILELDRLAVFGWSLGGHVAIELLAHCPRVEGLMLCGTPPLGRGPLASLRGFHVRWDLLLASKEQFSARDADRFLHTCFRDGGDPAFLASILRADGRLRTTFFRSLMRGEGIDQRRAVEEAQIPIALVNGAEDPSVRLSYVAGIGGPALWEGRAHVIDGAGHAPFWDQPAAFNRLFQSFFHMVAEQGPHRLPEPVARRA